MRLPLLLLLAAAAAAPAARAASVTANKCIWRGEVVCEQSPAFTIAKMHTLTSSPADSPLAVSVLQVAAMEAACHVFPTEADCAAAAGCSWDKQQSPSCNVDLDLLAQRDVFKSGCPGSLMESYVRCGAAISEEGCDAAGPNCKWFDELAAGPPARQALRRRLQQRRALAQAGGAGGLPSAATRACMPKAMYALEKKGDEEGTKRVLKLIANHDPAVWGDCPVTAALRSMTKTCSGFSSPGTCKTASPLCRWNDLVRACVTTGAGQAGWVFGANATEITEGAKSCAKAASREACNAAGTVTVDPKLFISVQKGEFGVAANGASTGRAAAGAAALVAAAVAALFL